MKTFEGRKILGCVDADLYSFWLVQHALLDSLGANNAVRCEHGIYTAFQNFVSALDKRIDASLPGSDLEDSCLVVSLSAVGADQVTRGNAGATDGVAVKRLA